MFYECILKYFVEGTTPRVIAERDDAALLTQEGNCLVALSSSARNLHEAYVQPSRLRSSVMCAV